MDNAGRLARRWAPALAFALLFVLSLQPIGSYDYFWHLATGRWIAEHRALPLHDPFALASDRAAWINGEWLFQIPLFGVWRLGGHAGVVVVEAALVAALFAWMLGRIATRTDLAVAALVVALSWSQAAHRFDARPETAAVILMAATVAILRAAPTRKRTAFAILVTAIWINVHPSALLAPVIAVCFLVGDLVAARFSGAESFWRSRLAQVLGVSLALLVNPWGFEAVRAPVRLAGFLQSSGIVNLEWLATSPQRFPLVYLLIAAAFALFAVSRERLRHTGSILVLALASILAIRFVRNHALLFASLPLLVEPVLPRQFAPRILFWVRVTLVIALAWFIAGRTAPGLGPDRELFPVHAVAALERPGLRGNVYNPDQFGGYLIWTFYPERRILTDGRNELHRGFLAEYDKARLDGRAWDALIRRYDLRIAVEEYRPRPMETVEASTGRTRTLPASLVYFPRSRWALIAWDDAGMVFARRDAFPTDLLAPNELRSLVPDATDPGSVALGDTALALAELERSAEARGPSRRAALLQRLLRARAEAESGSDSRAE